MPQQIISHFGRFIVFLFLRLNNRVLEFCCKGTMPKPFLQTNPATLYELAVLLYESHVGKFMPKNKGAVVCPLIQCTNSM